MTETAEEDRHCRRRGRPRTIRTAAGKTASRCYTPGCSPNDRDAIVLLLPDEMAVLNLIDLQGLEQEQAAAALGVSRKTVWKDIHEARHKIADALINGKVIEVSGCQRMLEGRCPRQDRQMCPKKDGGICPRIETASPQNGRQAD